MIPIKEYFNETDSKVFYKDLETKRTKVGGQLTPLFDALILSKFRADLYGAKQVEDKLLSFFHGKCAFCERFQSDETKRSKGEKRIWQIDHYRPKAGSNSYFWLVYECTNLLLSCFHCNFHKKELFEIIGKRAEIADFLVDGKLDFSKCSISNEIFEKEMPLLLNPVIDTPKNHLKFNADGTLEAKNGSKIGETSIKCYGLDREDLDRERKKIVDDMRISVNKNIQAVMIENNYRKPKQKTFDGLVDSAVRNLWLSINHPKTEFIAFRVAIFENFIDFVINNKNGIGSDRFELLFSDELEAAYKRLLP